MPAMTTNLVKVKKDPRRFASAPVASGAGGASRPLLQAGLSALASTTQKVPIPDVGFFDPGSAHEPSCPSLAKTLSSPLSPNSLSAGVLWRAGRPVSAPARGMHEIRPASPEITFKALEKKTEVVVVVAEVKPVVEEPPMANSLIRRRGSCPCLKINTDKRPRSAGKNNPARRVSFGDGQELFEAFTPYSKKYGTHPDDFYFDKKGHMVLSASCGESEQNILEVKVEEIIECLVDEGVMYHTRPQLNAVFKEEKRISLGDKVVVKQKCDKWAKDDIGWVKLLHKGGEPAFQVRTPKDKLKYAEPRVPVMSSACDDDPMSP